MGYQFNLAKAIFKHLAQIIYDYYKFQLGVMILAPLAKYFNEIHIIFKMKNALKKSITLLSLILIISCADSSVNSEVSLEEEINMGTPYQNITISFRGESPPARFGTGDGVTNYEEAHAEDGFFIIRTSNSNRIFYNLDTVLDVQIDPGSSLSLTY